MELFDTEQTGEERREHVPLAERVRPSTLDEFVGQEHLLGEGKPLRTLLMSDRLPSMIFWGPPGCGKTTLARLIARHTEAAFFQLNAVSSGVKDVREVLDRAAVNRKRHQRHTLLFIDEIHRFNKAQQDALLHSVEEGVITLIGATTENPSFEVISPLLSRSRVYVLKPLTREQLLSILDHALARDELLSRLRIRLNDRDLLIMLSGGDARVLLNGLEIAVALASPGDGYDRVVTREHLEEAFQRRYAKYDKGGEEHYNIISAFIKSVRGSDPDAAVYWLARMLEGGEDPLFIARRLIILASEDIGNADPGALTIATSCFSAVNYIGMPEATLVLSQTVTYLASAPKSNASTIAINQALSDVREKPNGPVPLALRNAPTGFMAGLGYGKDYKYSHDFEGHFVEQDFLPENINGTVYYKPTNNGEERTIRERLNTWWKSRQR